MLFFGQKRYKVCAVIAAGGSSSRMGFDKMTAELSGEPVLLRSIAAFERCSAVDEIVVAAGKPAAGLLRRCGAAGRFKKLKAIADAGESRQRSVYNGVLASSDDADLVCIHDGARPLVSQRVILSALEAAARHNAATASVPVKDTVKLGENGMIKATLPRESLYQIQTPQVFSKRLYLEAYGAAARDYSDDCQLVEALGGPVALSEGDYGNIKLTTAGDFAAAEAILKRMGEEK